MMNVLNGGAHASNNLDIQEFMIVPQLAKFKDRVRAGAEVFGQLKNVLAAKKLGTNVGDEGGCAPDLPNNEEALKILMQAIKKAGYQPGKDVALALDAAASEFYQRKLQAVAQYRIDGKNISAFSLIRKYTNWINKYPLISLEDPLGEDDWTNWRIMTSELKDRVMLIGDDLFVTNIHRLQLGIDKEAANTILIKPNQIGTLSETIDCIRLARENNFKIVISHRSGETEDTTIADLAVAVQAEFIKTSISRSERVAKYNRLMAIAEELGQ